ncbi:olfactory receptor 1-like [Bufo gargarizans]|uniref:olfactory receptor 1-like n=1 Tax=Bufo gargarizans TaxID=30331 RepID=UPI001CF232B8|nr:olfactory receptor 1-like [Bufo gargarizans]
MENTSYFGELHILPFAARHQDKPFLFSLFLCIYTSGVLVNVTSIAVIYLDTRLHNPMYLFLSMLSMVDICYTTVIIPMLLDMLFSTGNKVSLTQCFTQMFFFFMACGAEDIIMFIMAYDRYVAICSPLHYTQIFSQKNCLLIAIAIWITGALNSFLFTMSASNMSFCRSNTIQHIYCDSKALTKIACVGTELFYVVMYLELLVFGVGSFVCSLTSYIKILSVILRMKSEDGRIKVFSTCSSHLAVLLLYYSTGVSAFLIPSSEQSYLLDQIFTALYSTLTPILNPLIYSLRNNDVKRALLRLLGVHKR